MVLKNPPHHFDPSNFSEVLSLCKVLRIKVAVEISALGCCSSAQGASAIYRMGIVLSCPKKLHSCFEFLF